MELREVSACECVDALLARGIPARLWNGVPFIPVEVVPSLEDKKRALEVVGQLGLHCDLWAEGMVVRP